MFVEYEQDYSIAVEQGRKRGRKNPRCFFY